THIDVDRRLPLRLELQEHESAHRHRGLGLDPAPRHGEIADGALTLAAVFPVDGDGNARGEPLGIAPVEGHADIALAPPEPEEAMLADLALEGINIAQAERLLHEPGPVGAAHQLALALGAGGRFHGALSSPGEAGDAGDGAAGAPVSRPARNFCSRASPSSFTWTNWRPTRPDWTERTTATSTRMGRSPGEGWRSSSRCWPGSSGASVSMLMPPTDRSRARLGCAPFASQSVVQKSTVCRECCRRSEPERRVRT